MFRLLFWILAPVIVILTATTVLDAISSLPDFDLFFRKLVFLLLLFLILPFIFQTFLEAHLLPINWSEFAKKYSMEYRSGDAYSWGTDSGARVTGYINQRSFRMVCDHADDPGGEGSWSIGVLKCYKVELNVYVKEVPDIVFAHSGLMARLLYGCIMLTRIKTGDIELDRAVAVYGKTTDAENTVQKFLTEARKGAFLIMAKNKFSLKNGWLTRKSFFPIVSRKKLSKLVDTLIAIKSGLEEG